ncbi:hypothetical protein PRUPE_7G077200 [Prunus persica]|uniref:Uncharacterized protein n=1 Tax=Prunus persica TaxID=3760 RepID=A0A251N8A6_PRUPE|nr:hypothetical protein PRUPE_7G077200 [Prunus persica]
MFLLFWVFFPSLHPRLVLCQLGLSWCCYLKKFNLFILKKKSLMRKLVPLMDSMEVELCCLSILFCVLGVDLDVQLWKMIRFLFIECSLFSFFSGVCIEIFVFLYCIVFLFHSRVRPFVLRSQ